MQHSNDADDEDTVGTEDAPTGVEDTDWDTSDLTTEELEELLNS